MFDYRMVKSAAREKLRGNHWLVVLVCLIAYTLGAGATGVTFSGGGFNFNFNTGSGVDTGSSAATMTDGAAVAVILIVALVLMVVYTLIVVAAIAYSVFVGNVVRVGLAAWTIRFYRGEEVKVKELFAPFKTMYKKAVGVMFMKDLKVFLWSLLFLIPGIVKEYAYSMVPFLLRDNPNLTPQQALEMSNTMTMGYKWDLFVLQLSFIGWNLLNIFTFGVLGTLFVNPYYELTCAGAYEDLKWIAIQSGKLSDADFGVCAIPAETEIIAPAEPEADAE